MLKIVEHGMKGMSFDHETFPKKPLERNRNLLKVKLRSGWYVTELYS